MYPCTCQPYCRPQLYICFVCIFSIRVLTHVHAHKLWKFLRVWSCWAKTVVNLSTQRVSYHMFFWVTWNLCIKKSPSSPDMVTGAHGKAWRNLGVEPVASISGQWNVTGDASRCQLQWSWPVEVIVISHNREPGSQNVLYMVFVQKSLINMSWVLEMFRVHTEWSLIIIGSHISCHSGCAFHNSTMQHFTSQVGVHYPLLGGTQRPPFQVLLCSLRWTMGHGCLKLGKLWFYPCCMCHMRLTWEGLTQFPECHRFLWFFNVHQRLSVLCVCARRWACVSINRC